MSDHRQCRRPPVLAIADGHDYSLVVIGAAMPGHDHLIMIVEDHTDLRETFRDVLAASGIQSVEASSGREALTLLREQPRKPCLILLDIFMPDVDGWEFRLAQLGDPRLADIPVVLLTAHVGAEGAAREMNASGFLKKPVTLDTLLSSIERHCTHE
jgi:CheY-like chemotaxis protein